MLQDAQCTVRPARPDDLPAVVEAYNAGISERIATFETRLRTVTDVSAWLDDGRPFIVAERDGRAQGLGRQLLTELCAASERRGLYKLTSRVFADNHASRAAHRAAGFEEVGVQRRHGQLDGQWKDCVLIEKLLGIAAKPE